MATYDSLATRYLSAPCVVRAGRTYPVTILTTECELDGLVQVHTTESEIDAQLFAAGNAHLQSTIDERPHTHDGPLLTLLEIGSDVSLSAGLSSYFAMIATCDALAHEWTDATSPHSVPLRDRADEAAGDRGPIVSGSGRAAAIGVSVVTTRPSRTGRQAFFGLRRADLATDPGRVHVGPSGMLEPNGPQPLVATVRRELAEELGVRLKSEKLLSRLRVLGVGIDLLRLRPEVCLRLDLSDIEADLVSEAAWTSEFDSAFWLSIDSVSLGAWWKTVSPETLTPAAAAAVALLEAGLASA